MGFGAYGDTFKKWGDQAVNATDVNASDDLTVGDDATITDALTVKGVLTVGDGTGSPGVRVLKTDAGTADVSWASGGFNRGQIRLDASENLLMLARDGAGAIAFTTTYANATGDWTFPTDAYVGSQLTVGATSQAFAGNIASFTGNSGRVLVHDAVTDATNKAMRLGTAHYTNAEEPFFAYNTSLTSTGNTANIGGGTSIGNAATLIQFFTAANNTTTTGTVAGSINTLQNWTIGVDGGSNSHVIYGTLSTWASNNTDATDKSHVFQSRARTISQGVWQWAAVSATSGANTLRVGGHTSADSATAIELYTATALDTAGTLAGSVTSAQVLDWVTDIRGRTFFADGDEGTGIASTVGLTNVIAAAGDTAAVLGNWRVNGSAGTFHGWLKLWDGTTYISIPCWRAS